MTSGGGTRTRSAVAPSTSTCCSSSRDLSDEWRRCCTGVLFPGLALEFDGASPDRGLIGRDGTPGRWGEDDFDFNDDDGEVPVINLLDLPGEEEEEGYHHDDLGRPSDVAAGTGGTTDANSNWYDNAALLYDSIADVSDLLRRKGRDYADCDFRLTTTTTTGNGEDGGGETTRMTEAERVLLETTVMSFAASTATQIDLLRKQHEEIQKHRTTSTNSTTSTFGGGDEDMHRSGIVAVLLNRLKSDVALPMERLQTIRRREANVARRNPLTCGVAPEVVRKQPQRPADILLDEDDEEDTHMNDGRRREVIAAAMEAAASSTADGPLTDRTREEDEEFRAAYLDDDDLTDVNFSDDGFDDPDADGPMKRRKTRHEDAAEAKDDAGFRPVVENVEYNTTYHEFEKNREQRRREEQARQQQRLQQPQQPQVFQEESEDPYGGGDSQRHVVEELRAEHLLLEAQFHDGELENVQRIEERMVEITTLLNRFTDLISEQREDVLLLHENTKQSTTNMEKGEDKLEEARERGKKSKHYMAKIIIFLALLLLFLNWVTP